MKTKLLSLALLSFVISPTGCGGSIVVDGRQTAGNNGGINAIRGMSTRRAAHTATLLGNGKVLVAGGFTGDENSLASAEIFDPATTTFAPGGNMSVARAGHSATLLPNGKVLIAGGYNGKYLDSAEIYDPETDGFTSAGTMTTPRSGHVAVSLNNGRVLLVGGVGTGWTFLADAELYNPVGNAFTKTGNMNAARESHTATLLKDGQVLITGGHRGRRKEITIYSRAEIYDPASGMFTQTGTLTIKRHKHDAALLNDGRVLIVGGSDERDSRGAYATAEIYDPKTKTFASIGNMNLPRYKLQGTTVLLKNGKVLIGGGSNQAEVFDPKTSTFDVAAGKFETTRLFATAILLQNGEVLITGGYDSDQVVSSKAWVYKSSS